MARRRRQERVEPSRKEQAMTRREREQARRITIIVGAVLGVAVLLLVIGLVAQFVITPASAVAVIDSENIKTNDFWDRSKFEQLQSLSQLQQLLDFQQQIDPTGEQGFFTSQIQQLQSRLANPEGLANTVLEDMIDETVIKQAAAANGVVASEEQIQQQLEELIAGQIGAVTVPQATATAEAAVAATATAAAFPPTPMPTPSPIPTVTLSSALTATLTNTLATTDTVAPTAEPQPTPTVHILAPDEYTTSYQELISNISTQGDIRQASTEQIYRNLITVDLLRQELLDKVGDQMPTSGERVRARHILITVPQDASDVDEQAALAKAISITQRLEAGEDFAALAEQYSDDPGSAANGGDLDFFTRGMMVPEFEDAAFSLPIGEISDPVRSSFGYHIIKIEEKDQGDPDFNLWLQQLKAEKNIERRLTDSRLPNLPAVPLQLLTAGAAAPAPVTLPTPEPTAAQ